MVFIRILATTFRSIMQVRHAIVPRHHSGMCHHAIRIVHVEQFASRSMRFEMESLIFFVSVSIGNRYESESVMVQSRNTWNFLNKPKYWTQQGVNLGPTIGLLKKATKRYFNAKKMWEKKGLKQWRYSFGSISIFFFIYPLCLQCVKSNREMVVFMKNVPRIAEKFFN